MDPNILAIRTLGDARIAHLAVNPRVTGVELPVGTIAVYEGNIYQKNGAGNTDYAELPDLTKDAHFIDSKLGLKNASEATIFEIALGATDNPSIETFNSQNLSFKHNSLERLSISPASVSIFDHQQSAVVQVSQGEVSVFGGMDLNDNVLSGLAEPVDASDAATRSFVATMEQGLSADISDLSDSVNNDLSLLEGNLQSQINDRIELAEKGVALGVATLDSQARIPSNQLPLDAVTFEGTWDASTNTPALADGTGTNGEFYIIDTDGTQDLGSGPIEFNEGNRVFYDGAIWKEVGASDRVISVNEKVGIVTLDTDDITEGALNLYYTQQRFTDDFATKTTADLTEDPSNLYYTDQRFDDRLATKDTDDILEGAINFYYTEARFDNSLATKDTDNLAEGTGNLYYTNARFDSQLATKDTDDVVEGVNNLYYTEQRFDDRFNTKDTDDLTESATNKFLTTGTQTIEGEKTIQDRLNIESSVVNNVSTIAATEIDWSTGNVYEKDIVADTTFTFTGDNSGQTIIVKIQNLDNATRTINFPAGVLWSDGVVVDTIPQDGTHIYTFIKVGTTIYASALENMS